MHGLAGLEKVVDMRTTLFDTRPGLDLARAIKTLAANAGNIHAAESVAARNYGAGSPAHTILAKAAIAPALTTAPTWGGNVADQNGREFFSAADELSVIGRLPGVRRVPLNVNLSGAAAEFTASWRGQGNPAPIRSMAFDDSPLPPRILTSACAFSIELARCAQVEAEEVFRSQLMRSVAHQADADFLNPANAGTADEKPASVSNGLTPTAATANARADIANLVDAFAGDLTQAAFVGSPKVFARLNSQERQFVGLRDGELLNSPCLAVRNAPDEVLFLIDGSGIALGDDGFAFSASTQTSLQMNDAPSGAAAHVSAWQSGLVAVKIERRINWRVVRPASVALIDGISW